MKSKHDLAEENKNLIFENSLINGAYFQLSEATKKLKEIEIINQKKTKELERINKFMVGREMKMIELKNKIKVLETKLNNRGKLGK